MSVDESRSSTPLVSTSESSSPAASSSIPDSQGACFNGYQSGVGENARVESPSQGITLPNNIYMHRIQSSSPADDHQFIRRPLNAYMIFTKQERKKLLALNPNMKMHEASRIMGEKWKNMSEKEKRQYFEASKQNRLDHKKFKRMSAITSSSYSLLVAVRQSNCSLRIHLPNVAWLLAISFTDRAFCQFNLPVDSATFFELRFEILFKYQCIKIE